MGLYGLGWRLFIGSFGARECMVLLRSLVVLGYTLDMHMDKGSKMA